MNEKDSISNCIIGFVTGVVVAIFAAGIFFLRYTRDTGNRVRELESKLTESQQLIEDYNNRIREYSDRLTAAEQREAKLNSQLAEYGRRAKATADDMGRILDRDATTIGDIRKTIQDLKDCLMGFNTYCAGCGVSNHIGSNTTVEVDNE